MADNSNQGLLLPGGARARRAATPQHPFGFGRERYFWSFVVALVLLTLGGIFALFEGIEKLRRPHEVGDLKVAVGVLVLAIVFEFFSLRTAVRESGKAKGAATWWHFVRTSRTPVRTQHLGPEDLLVSVKIALEPDLDLLDVPATINGAAAAVRQAVPAARIIYVEPDVLAAADGKGGEFERR